MVLMVRISLLYQICLLSYIEKWISENVIFGLGPLATLKTKERNLIFWEPWIRSN